MPYVSVWNGGMTESTASVHYLYRVLIKKKKCEEKEMKKSSVASAA